MNLAWAIFFLLFSKTRCSQECNQTYLLYSRQCQAKVVTGAAWCHGFASCADIRWVNQTSTSLICGGAASCTNAQQLEQLQGSYITDAEWKYANDDGFISRANIDAIFYRNASIETFASMGLLI